MLAPVTLELRIHNTVVTRRMKETLFVRHDSNVVLPVKEDQRAELELLAWWRRLKAGPERAGTASLEIDTGTPKRAPHKT